MIFARPHSLSNDELQRAINDAATLAKNTNYDLRSSLTEHLKALCAEQAKRAKGPHVQITPSTPAEPPAKAGGRTDASSAGDPGSTSP
jgi:hypothetical protein